MRTKKAFSAILSALLIFAAFPLPAFAAAPLDGYPKIEDLPEFKTLPNPFEFFSSENDPNGDGYVSDVGEWDARREELKDILQRYYLGYRWPTKPENVSGAALVDVETGMVSGASITVENPDRNVSRSFNITVSMPTRAQRLAVWGDEDAEVPFVITIGSVGAMSAANLNPQGYALVTFSTASIYNDNRGDDTIRTGLYLDLYPFDANEYEYASGCIMAWGWAASQILNALEQPGPVEGESFAQHLGLDNTRTVISGHSRNGLAAMVEAAFDDRISVCAASEPGGNGFRYRVEGKIFNINFEYYPKADRVYGKTGLLYYQQGNGSTWFPPTNDMFTAKEFQQPFDFSSIISLVAPRPYVTFFGIDQHWQGNEGCVATAMAAGEVYNFIGADEIEKNNIAYRARESAHTFYARDLPFVLAVMDREFKQGDNDQTLHVQDLFPNGTAPNGGMATNNMSYPAADYSTAAEMSSNPFEINSSYIPWSSPDKYSLWTTQENFLVGYPATITAYSDAPEVSLYLPDGKTKITATESGDGAFTFSLTARQAIYGRYELRSAGSSKENRSIFFAAVSLSDALRHGATKGDEGEENRVMGFSSRLANNDGDLPLVFVTGDSKPLTMSQTLPRFKTEETTLLDYGILFHDPLFVRLGNSGEWEKDNDHTFNVKNLKFVAIPDYVFEISYSDIYASALNSGKDGASQFTKPISWKVEKFNNGPAPVWPVWPDTQAEKLSGEVSRPESPEPASTNFKAEITGFNVKLNGSATDIEIFFSEALRTGEYGFGLDIADSWTTVWSENGAKVTLSIANSDISKSSVDGNLIIYRLMDLDGNLIAGPIEKNFRLPSEQSPEESAPNYSYPSGSGYSSASLPQTYISQGKASEIIKKALGYGINTLFELTGALNEIYFAGSDLNSSAAAGKDVIIKNKKFSIDISSNLAKEWNLAENDNVRIGFSLNPFAAEQVLEDKLVGIDSQNEQLIKEIYASIIQINSAYASTTASPIKIAVDISDLNLSDSQKAKLTGVIYDSALKSYRQLGGELSADGKTFEFYAYSTGNYGIIIADSLTKIRFAIDSLDYYKNGIRTANDAAPYISAENRTMLPLRAVAETLGAKVSWSDAAKTVTIAKGGQTLALIIGKALPNGLGMPVIRNDRTFVPIRYIAEQLGANVVWIEETRTVNIYQ
ncbi:MAG: copper amine oxidase N-terminal domain-containing protein [Clostridiales bacterium]|jgi:hypothetical protein|nr:copper amine oxidase N-terminal domain-containing protein [Clostridiales bacterium]